MLKKYLMIFLVSMVPLIELRGAVPIAVGMNLPLLPSYIICILGNMLPVPIIFFFARKVLEWGADKPVISKFVRHGFQVQCHCSNVRCGSGRRDHGIAQHGSIRRIGDYFLKKLEMLQLWRIRKKSIQTLQEYMTN